MKYKTHIFCVFVISCLRIIHVNGSDIQERSDDPSKNHTIDSFVRQFSVFFWQNLFSNAINPTFRKNNVGDLKQNVYDLQGVSNYGFGIRPSSPNSLPVYPYPPQRPFPPSTGGLPPFTGRPGVNTGYPPPAYPPYRPGYQFLYGGGGGYPQGSFFAALDSISRYDDLRCVPRLLCEVTTGSRTKSYRPSYPPDNVDGNISPIPFLSRDALITLLTILNFVDDSPILSFARAAFLGYSSKGDTRACLTAYPTCPRDPDQLIDYLNNHNGGFFRFFNQQLQQQPQYAPQYQQFIQKYQQQYENNQLLNNPTRSPNAISQTEDITPRYADRIYKQNQNSRILNDPIDIEYVGKRITNVFLELQHQKQQPLRQLRHENNKLVFQDDDQIVLSQIHKNFRYENEPDFDTRRGKKFTFPKN